MQNGRFQEPIPYPMPVRTGEKDIAAFFSDLAKAVTFSEFVPDRILQADEHTVVSIGHYSATVNATGKEAKSDWVMMDEFDEQGMLVRFHDYADTQNIADAFRSDDRKNN